MLLNRWPAVNPLTWVACGRRRSPDAAAAAGSPGAGLAGLPVRWSATAGRSAARRPSCWARPPAPDPFCRRTVHRRTALACARGAAHRFRRRTGAAARPDSAAGRAGWPPTAPVAATCRTSDQGILGRSNPRRGCSRASATSPTGKPLIPRNHPGMGAQLSTRRLGGTVYLAVVPTYLKSDQRARHPGIRAGPMACRRRSARVRMLSGEVTNLLI